MAWDAESLAVISTWDSSLDEVVAGSSRIKGLAVGNRRLVCASDNGIIRAFPASGTGALKPETTLAVQDREYVQAVLDRDESWTILSTLTGAVEVRDLPRLDLLASVPGHSLPVRALALGAGDCLLATGCDDGWIRLFRVDSSRQIRAWIKFNTRAGPVDRLRLSANGHYLAAATRGATSITVWDLAALEKELAVAADDGAFAR